MSNKKRIFGIVGVILIAVLLFPAIYMAVHTKTGEEVVKLTYNSSGSASSYKYVDNYSNSYSLDGYSGSYAISGMANSAAISDDIEYYDDSVYADEYIDYDTDTTSSTSLLDGKLLKKSYSYRIETIYYDDFIKDMSETITSLGGYVDYYNEYSRDYDNSDFTKTYTVREGYYTVRIPTDKSYALQDFFTVSNDNSTSDITYQNQSVEDVTSYHMDLETHIEALRVEYDTLYALLSQAVNVTEIMEVQDRLSDINYEISSYEKQLENLDKDIAYDTYDVTIDEVIFYKDTVKHFTSDLAESWAYAFEEWLEDVLPNILLVTVSLIPIIAIIGIAVVFISKRIAKGKKTLVIETKEYKEE